MLHATSSVGHMSLAIYNKWRSTAVEVQRLILANVLFCSAMRYSEFSIDMSKKKLLTLSGGDECLVLVKTFLLG
ncbi:hypothetical protein [Candidatus Enterovibrio escicola]|uniref:hypothetical protein n=1 Tax=Candidatus Enterovibrio escicola TaxID=1927127 RepID=UPI0011BA81D9|nr:hypothetical protein [Candidatus Enterovibrio escacola]